MENRVRVEPSPRCLLPRSHADAMCVAFKSFPLANIKVTTVFKDAVSERNMEELTQGHSPRNVLIKRLSIINRRYDLIVDTVISPKVTARLWNCQNDLNWCTTPRAVWNPKADVLSNPFFVLLYVPSGNAEITCVLYILLNTTLIAPRCTLLHLHAFWSNLNPVTFPISLLASSSSSNVSIRRPDRRVWWRQTRWGRGRWLGSNNDNTEISFHDWLLCLQNPEQRCVLERREFLKH